MRRLSEIIDKDIQFLGDIPCIQSNSVSIIIPVKDNQKGVDRFLSGFFSTQHNSLFPREVIIVDNNSRVPIHIKEEFLNRGLDIKVLFCKKPGPAAARNIGIQSSNGEWLLFCDSDCIPTNSLITGYLNSKKKAIAFAGNVKSQTDFWLDGFYTREETLLPRRKPNKEMELVPLYIVTANALVWKKVLIKLGYFDESFNNAGGEDVELSKRLWEVGNIKFIEESVVLHNYGNGIKDFCKRFIRYGKGNRQLERIHKIKMNPVFHKPKERTPLNYIVKAIQHLSLSTGYLIEKLRNK
jgi:glycosyltransferase involved in cell wall biosynthesis